MFSRRVARRSFLQSAAVLWLAEAVLVACGPGTVAIPATPPAETPKPTAAPKAVTSPKPAARPRVVIFAPGDSGNIADWSKNPILLEVMKATNTEITVNKIGANYLDRVNAAIAAGSAPDIIGVINHENFGLWHRWIKDGVIAPFEGEVAEAAPNIVDQYRKNPTLNELRVDGKIYGDPVQWDWGNYPNMGLIHVRKDLLEKYGMQPPDTFEQYFEFLRAAIKDGQKGVLFNAKNGVGPAINAFVGAFGAPFRGWVKQGDRFESWAVVPGVKQGLLLFRRMVTEGLVHPASWETADKARDMYAAGDSASLIFNGGGHVGRIQNDMLLAGKGHREWLLPAPTAGGSLRGYTTEPQFWGLSFITKLPGNNPVAAARVMNFLDSEEGQQLTAIGIEGVHYKVVGGEIQLNQEQRIRDGFPAGTGQHPLATGIVSWVNHKWQFFDLLYGKDRAYKEWFEKQYENQGKYQIPTYGLLMATPQWVQFEPIGGELITRTFLQVVKAGSEKEASDLYDKFVQSWQSAGGAAATAEMSKALATLYK